MITITIIIHQVFWLRHALQDEITIIDSEDVEVSCQSCLTNAGESDQTDPAVAGMAACADQDPACQQHREAAQQNPAVAGMCACADQQA